MKPFKIGFISSGTRYSERSAAFFFNPDANVELAALKRRLFVFRFVSESRVGLGWISTPTSNGRGFPNGSARQTLASWVGGSQRADSAGPSALQRGQPPSPSSASAPQHQTPERESPKETPSPADLGPNVASSDGLIPPSTDSTSASVLVQPG